VAGRLILRKEVIARTKIWMYCVAEGIRKKLVIGESIEHMLEGPRRFLGEEM
jgi:hypothetical protein